MKRLFKAAACALALVFALALAGCGSGGGSSEDYSGISDNTVAGRSVYVDPSNIAFFGYDNLICSSKFEDGSMSEFVIEAGITGKIYALAVYDQNLYVSAADGIFKYSLEDFSSGELFSPVTLFKEHLSEFNQFEIYDGKMFFLYGTNLSYIPTDGGDKIDLTTETGDFEVTTQGIYYTKKDGSLHLLSSDFKEDKELATLTPAAQFSIADGMLFYRDDDDLMAYSIADNKTEEIDTEEDLNEYSFSWGIGGSVLYEDEDYRFHLISAENGEYSDKVIGEGYDYPSNKSFGYVYGNYLVSQENGRGTMKIIDAAGGTVKDYDLKTELAPALSRLQEKIAAQGQSGSSAQGGTAADGSGNSGSGGSGQTGSSADYDILEGLQIQKDGSALYLYGNDFMLIMPNDDDWAYEKTDNDTLRIYLVDAQESGYGGNLVTIKAYDLDDNSYEMLPSYSVAGVGRNVNKRFIAIFPTDVQWDHNDEDQEEDYRELYEHVHKIGEGAVNSPFRTQDSD